MSTRLGEGLAQLAALAFAARPEQVSAVRRSRTCCRLVPAAGGEVIAAIEQAGEVSHSCAHFRCATRGPLPSTSRALMGRQSVQGGAGQYPRVSGHQVDAVRRSTAALDRLERHARLRLPRLLAFSVGQGQTRVVIFHGVEVNCYMRSIIYL